MQNVTSPSKVRLLYLADPLRLTSKLRLLIVDTFCRYRKDYQYIWVYLGIFGCCYGACIPKCIFREMGAFFTAHLVDNEYHL